MEIDDAFRFWGEMRQARQASVSRSIREEFGIQEGTERDDTYARGPTSKEMPPRDPDRFCLCLCGR
jgi:hypothetical protein